ncbi:MAG: respiratory nitrate reductase subunit gamma [Deltaproteobacteria bacterium RIFCSPHIGHO2_02_FULL_40_11]|nr:MAG: respiratory nitrate reductase subunit gamma [Deltaproteobacteria bacterium RIFCSPHIGHO2_02_FULL_40_11]
MNTFFFVIYPYLAFFIFCVGFVYRYKQTGFQVSSLSSQFLESRTLYWGVMLFHWGIMVVFLGHLLAFLFPKGQLLWNTHPIRLILLEVTGFTFGLLVFVGLIFLILRRFISKKVFTVTSKMDFALEFLLLAQVILGCWIAVGYRWGSSWFAADLSPYLWSLVLFQPKIKAVSAMPYVIQFHIIGAFTILLLIPFTRLVHFLVAPFHYIWRPYQRVMWNWDPKKVRSAETVWTVTRPRNN